VYLVVEAPADPGRFRRVVRVVQGRQFLWMRIVGAVVVVIGVLELTVFAQVPLAVGLLCGGVVAVLGPTLAVRSAGASATTVNGEWTYVLSDSGVSARGPLMSSDHSWDAFRRARETATDVLLYLSNSQVLAIPREGLDQGQRLEMGAFLRARGLLP
jgi:hypothetical protein